MHLQNYSQICLHIIIVIQLATKYYALLLMRLIFHEVVINKVDKIASKSCYNKIAGYLLIYYGRNIFEYIMNIHKDL